MNDSFRRRGSSFSSSGVPPHVDAFRPGRDNYSNDYSYPESSFAPGGSGSFPPPPPGSMSASYPMGNSEQHSFPGFDSPPGFNPTGVPPPATGYPNSYDSSPLSDNQFPALVDEGGFSGQGGFASSQGGFSSRGRIDDGGFSGRGRIDDGGFSGRGRMDDGGFSNRGRTLSTGGGSFGPPGALVPSAPPMTPYASHYGLPKRARRASSVGPGMGMGYVAPDMYHRPGGRINIKFRLKGESNSGISINEALNRERLSQSHAYLMHDIAPDMTSRITLKVRWSGYHSNTYEIPLSGDYNGYVNIASLARRTARAIVHFMQTNGIMLPWDRVVVHRLEEIRPGIWIPVLITH